MIFHSYSRSRPPKAKTVALSLYEMFDKRTGRSGSKAAVRCSTTSNWPMTRGLFSAERKRFPDRAVVEPGQSRTGYARLIELGIAMITTPNYSFFGDVPRLDNLFNMKRIALVWSEIQREGIPCAIHLNARTDKDFQRWVEFLCDHPEITHIAFEFEAGAGAPNRIAWHIEHLNNLAQAVPRPLHLVVRGGGGELRVLRPAFSGITLIDTSPFVKTQKKGDAWC